MDRKHISDFDHQRRYSQAIKEALRSGMDSFHTFFDASESVEQSVLRGYWDMAFHILTRGVCAYIRDPQEKIALEIGYGGGRILNAACSYFNQVIGVDIHNEQETVGEFLRQQGKNNFRLIETSGRTIDVASESIDFVYSFIVLQHLPSFEVFESYLNETYRCLRVGGIAQLYFGRYSQLTRVEQMRFLFQGYREIPDAPVNHTSLVVRVRKARRLSSKCGFAVIGTGTSFKRAPDGYPDRVGGQSYTTLLKSDKQIGPHRR